ncbi:MAG: winged helix-turn-helix domain-containing protein [Pseudomonadaceae bacterium]|nr:winged helix-turn-helix domain-containing protein [Pseudomonadaceae bacterium]
MTPSSPGGSQSARLLASLKVALKAAGITYGDVAEHLGLSLSSVKRQLSRGGLSMERYEQIAALAGIDLLELARQAEAARGQLSQLSEAQEQALVADEALLLAAVCVLNRWRMQDLQDVYGFSEPEAVGLLTRLDALGLIELLPGNRIKLRSARNFSWRPFGPIHQYFVREHQNQFLGGRFSARTDAYQFRFGMISEESAAELSGTIEALLEKFQHLSQRDEIRPRGEGAGTCLLVAMREWEPKAFAALKAR